MTYIIGCSGTVRHQPFSFRILIGFFLLGAIVLVNSYSGIVISSLTLPKMKASIDSLEDLANSREVDVLLRSDVSTGEQILAIPINNIYFKISILFVIVNRR